MDSQNQLPSSPIENDAFWQKHHDLLKSGELSRKIYCRQHGLNYDRFGYWIKKQKSPVDEKLIAIKVKSTTATTALSALCTLELKNGCSLKIHDVQALSIILDRYS